MMKDGVMSEDFAVKDWSLKNVGSLKIPSFIFDLDPREDILSRVVHWQLAKRRAGTHKTKGISDVRGTTKKPYKQKGTGRARQGSLRSPQFRGGGVIFGPVVRDHSYSLPKKIRSLGLKMALSLRKQQEELTIMDSLGSPFKKTAEMVSWLKHFEGNSVLFVTSHKESGSLLNCVRNIPRINVLDQEGLNVYDILKHDRLILDKEVLPYLSERRFA